MQGSGAVRDDVVGVVETVPEFGAKSQDTLSRRNQR